MSEIHVHFPNGTSLTCPLGTRAEELVSHFGSLHDDIAAVRINNEILPLSTRIEINASLEPVLLDVPDGIMIYRRSLAFLLAMAAQEIFPKHSLYIGHSLGNSYYYTFAGEYKPGNDEIESLQNQMKHLVDADEAIEFSFMAYGEALELFRKNGQTGTAQLLDLRNESKIPVNTCGRFADLYIEPLVTRTGLLTGFELMPYQDGFLLRFPRHGGRKNIEPFQDSEKIFSVYSEYKKWGRIVGVHGVGQLNSHISNKTIHEYIRIAEAFQARKLAEIAERVYEKRDAAKVILIAGPSSSGKTTSAKRLSIELKVMGLEPVLISLDDYYLGTELTPKNEKGQPDYECLEALDIPLINKQLLDLFKGEEAEIPIYEFKKGKRKETGHKLRLNNRSVLIIEGIHGLNDALTHAIKRDRKFKIYVSALTQLNLDDHNRIPTSDNRLLRRMVRDNQFRGSDAIRTFKMWPGVQQGERKHIFPYQDSADVAFNSALDYELPVLKYYADPLLRSVKPNMREYSEARRILSFLENFAPIPPQYVPGTSILREFIGESEFKY